MGVDDAHDLLPEEIAQTLPPLSATQEQNDPLVRVKLFTPDSNWSWFVVEYGPAERLGFGLVIGFERELGYFSLAELEQVRGPWGLKLERDPAQRRILYDLSQVFDRLQNRDPEDRCVPLVQKSLMISMRILVEV